MRKGRIFNKDKTSKQYIIKNPTSLSDLQDYDLYDDEYESGDWREKARRLQARRWRKIKHQLV